MNKTNPDYYIAFLNFIKTMDWKVALTLAVPGIITVLGWTVVHWLTMRREMAIRKREARLKSLEAAYMRLATSSNREQLTNDAMNEIETFVSEIQLYGTPKQIELMTWLVEEFKKPNNKISYDEILKNLRDSIRKELNMEPVSGEVWWLRLHRKNVTSTNDRI